MTTILSIRDGQCLITNQQEFDAFVETATETLVEAMSKAFELLPFDYRSLARSYAEHLFTKDNLCSAIAPKKDIQDKEQAIKVRKKFAGEKANQKEALEYGVVGYREEPTMTEKCPADYSKNPVFLEGTTCEDVKDSIEDRRLPISMYSTHLPAKEARQEIGRLGNTKYYSTPGTEYHHCENGGKKAVHYKFPVWGAFTLEYALTNKSYDDYEVWQSVNSCSSDEEKYATDLMFTMGTRLFLDFPVEINGQEETRSIVVETVAASHPSAFVRGIVGEDKPFFGVLAGAITKRAFLAYQRYTSQK